MIEDYLKVHPNATETEIYEELKDGKLTFTKPYIRKVASIYRNHKDDKTKDTNMKFEGEFLTIEDIDRYVKKCMNDPSITPNTHLLNTGLKLLELKNKIEPEHLKRSEERERIMFEDTLKDALVYVHELRPDYETEVPSLSSSDDKTSEAEG